MNYVDPSGYVVQAFVIYASVWGNSPDTQRDMMIFSESGSAFMQNPNFWTGLAAGLDAGALLVAGVPAGGSEAVKGVKQTANTVKNFVKGVNRASSKVLRQNLINAGVDVPKYANAAHHIVAGTSQKASEARAILKKFEITINDAINGVFLPTAKNVANSVYHPALHTNTYYNKVNELLRSATSREDVIDILTDVANQLTNGTFFN